jgi:intracellular protein transport protein USO1
MLRMLESQAPAKQNATDTINTLSSRLQSATLLEDRRAAILGLRSFAKLYPASVASGALRNLISSLGSDGEDVDTTKVVLETLLMLFSPDESSVGRRRAARLAGVTDGGYSPRPRMTLRFGWRMSSLRRVRDRYPFFLAHIETNSDRFSLQHQENITVLLDLLDRNDFFSRLYSLQLLSAISSARPERTQECVHTAPLGVSRLVGVLDDKREAIRSGRNKILRSRSRIAPVLTTGLM